jgi:P27 family predicted phage terminase small subunit
MGQRGPLPDLLSKRSQKRGLASSKAAFVPTGCIAPPKHLDSAARAEFGRLVELLSEHPQTIAPRDGFALADLALCLVRLRMAEAEISARGLLIQAASGLVRNPASLTAKEYRTAVQAWCQKFGLTPDGRARLATPAEKVGGVDKLEEALCR